MLVKHFHWPCLAMFSSRLDKLSRAHMSFTCGVVKNTAAKLLVESIWSLELFENVAINAHVYASALHKVCFMVCDRWRRVRLAAYAVWGCWSLAAPNSAVKVNNHSGDRILPKHIFFVYFLIGAASVSRMDAVIAAYCGFRFPGTSPHLPGPRYK